MPYNWKAVARTICLTMAALVGLVTIATFPGQVYEANGTCGTVIVTMIFMEYIGVTFMCIGLICHASLNPLPGDKFKRRQAAAFLAILVFLTPIAWFFLARGVGGLMIGKAVTGHNLAWQPVGPIIQILLSMTLLIVLTLTLIRFFRPKKGC